MFNRPTGVSSPGVNGPEMDNGLKKAIGDLHTWTWTLSGEEEDSVCLDKDVGEVVKDMIQQWKNSKQHNILPVMDFIIWSILQQDGIKGSIAKYWNRNEELLQNRAAQQPIPESVWKWITKTTDKVRLDPSTANPCLEISDDMTAMKMHQIAEMDWNSWDNFERDRHKFDGWWCVLGNEGFVSGKHYWEVDVQGKEEWRLGVVSESAPRNGFQSLNETTGYWTLKLQLGQLMAMTFPVTKLDKCAPRVLGMFLDMEEGQMSFYDVHVDHRFHIYSFNVNFKRNKKVFPVFGTVETKREMRILG
ncbi:hypothetical protein NHX12_034416 [Muraenolepis orangiensis]|uniref:B30.2/SPRY domain-containing protein n=1 Tax=Muraenolepis orangiensis TaxID=630683 RepID=A0A9Q0D8T2_9TELE|nr:hypothetical protein NHX12_034416 [Muraenolepis orangiensis]